MSKRIQRAFARQPEMKASHWLLPVIALAGCGGEEPQPFSQPLGPPGGMIEADGGLRPSAGGTGAGYGGAGGAAGSSGAGAGGGAGSAGTGDGGQLLNGGIGKVCTTDADCPTGLTCNIDTQDWISHRQCSTFCDSSEFCESKFGSHTMCIGANLCVSKCLDDSDCPATTICNSNDWCGNTGPGSGVPKCTGVPTPCSLLGQVDCGSSLGCTWSGDCNGVSESCYSQYDSYSCTSQEGCFWSSSSSSCSGSSRSCSGYISQFSCTDQDGCRWDADCSGTPIYSRCEDISAALCRFTPGCLLVSQ